MEIALFGALNHDQNRGFFSKVIIFQNERKSQWDLSRRPRMTPVVATVHLEHFMPVRNSAALPAAFVRALRDRALIARRISTLPCPISLWD